MSIELDVFDELDEFERHSAVEEICRGLHSVLVGRSAENALEREDRKAAGLVILPSWLWLHSRINVGRKDAGTDGQRLLLPVRLNWQPGCVQVVPANTKVEAAWSAVGLGHQGNGTTTIGTDRAGKHTGTFDPQDASDVRPPETLHLEAITGVEIDRELRRLVEEGRNAYWQLMFRLEPMVRKSLGRTHASISYEIAGDNTGSASMLDPIEMAALVDQVLLGEDGMGPIHRLIERCLEPSIFMKVDPLRYISAAIHIESLAAVRKAIGDPWIGKKIRDMAREIESDDIDEVVQAYGERYPKDRLSTRRAHAALTIQPKPEANRLHLDQIIDQIHGGTSRAAIFAPNLASKSASQKPQNVTPDSKNGPVRVVRADDEEQS